jgi:hypothetical protein
MVRARLCKSSKRVISLVGFLGVFYSRRSYAKKKKKKNYTAVLKSQMLQSDWP